MRKEKRIARPSVQGNTKTGFGEDTGSPALSVLDIERFASLPTATVCRFLLTIPLPLPYFAVPLEFGADMVIHCFTNTWTASAIHSLAGVIVDEAESLTGPTAIFRNSPSQMKPITALVYT